MRFVWLSWLICFVVPVLAADGLADCASIQDPGERLACYDGLAASQALERAAAHRRERSGAAPAPRAPEAEPPLDVPPAPLAGATRPASGDDEPLDRFGKESQWKPAVEVDHMEARIDDVRTGPLGHCVMTLSNGQVWMENEPGRRPIRAGQEVTITRHRWHFEMELKSQPNVAVHRLQ